MKRIKTDCSWCFWYDACKKTKVACHKFQNVDMRWEESPNNKRGRLR